MGDFLGAPVSAVLHIEVPIHRIVPLVHNPKSWSETRGRKVGYAWGLVKMGKVVFFLIWHCRYLVKTWNTCGILLQFIMGNGKSHLVWIRSSISHGRFSNASSSIARFNPMFQAKWMSTQNIYLKITSSLLSLSPQAWSAAKQLNHLCWFEIVPSHKRLVAAWCIFLWNPFDHAKSFLDWWNSGPGKCKHEKWRRTIYSNNNWS